MIKRYKDFDTTEYLSRERESMERELRARKTRRNNMKYDLEINFDLIKKQILYAIENGEDYVLSMGKRKEELENSVETVFHIEFENERLGRVRIFKPKDTSTKGHYEVNGDYYETCAKEVRGFYHNLMQEIKGDPVVFESIVDKMVGKTEKELEEAKEKTLDKAVMFALDYYPERFDDYGDAYEYFGYYEDDIARDVEDGKDVEEVVKNIIDGKW
jgi:hypothetical protein